MSSSAKALVAVGAMVANRLLLLDAYAFLRRKLTGSQVAILLYHRIGSEYAGWSLRPKPLSSQIFESQMEYFCHNFEILSLDRLAHHLLQGSLPEKAAVITFDDGYKDNYLYAYPILKKYHIPATMFLTTGHIGTDKLFWWDKVSYIIRHTAVKQLDLSDLGCLPLQSESDKIHANSLITERLKKLPDEEKNLLIEKLFNISGTVIPPGLGRELILSWDEVIEMSNDGIAFGAHSVNHPVLTNLPLEQAKGEILQSKQDIEEKLGKVVTTFAYPNGDFNAELVKFIGESGFVCAVSVLPGKLISSKDNIYQLSRIAPIEDFNKCMGKFSGLWGDLQDTILRLRR